MGSSIGYVDPFVLHLYAALAEKEGFESGVRRKRFLQGADLFLPG